MTTPPETEHPADVLRRYRRPEPSFVRAVGKALGDARTVRELRSGPVSYVPADRHIVAGGTADATLVTFPTVAALEGSAPTDAGPVVVLARDPVRVRAGWLAEYAPDVVAAEAEGLPDVEQLAALVGTSVEIVRLPVPFTCLDGFGEGYYARPERLLDAGVRAADPAWSSVDDLTARRSIAALRDAIASGEWDARHGALRRQPMLDGSIVLLRAVP